MNDLDFRVAELERRLASVMLHAVVLDVLGETATVRVRVGEWESGWLPWLTARAAGADASWDAPRVGEKVILFSPNGERALGVVMPALYCSDLPAPSTALQESLVVTHDGARVRYDRDSSAAEVIIPKTGTLRVTLGAAELLLTDDVSTLSVGSSTVVLREDKITIQSGSVDLGGAGGPGVARIGDAVNPQTMKIMEGSDVVTAK